MPAFLLILGDREGLRWVLANQAMAFPARRLGAIDALADGDRLLLYTTRGCFGNPTRDRGRVIGAATVTGAVRAIEGQQIGKRSFGSRCNLDIRCLAPRGSGVELAPIIDQLQVFPDPVSWSAWMRRPLLALPEQDAALLTMNLDEIAVTPDAARGSYFD